MGKLSPKGKEMFEPLGNPPFIKEIREGWIRPFSTFKVVLAFFLLCIVGNALQRAVLLPVAFGVVLSSKDILAVLSDPTALEDGRLAEITERMLRTDAVVVATLFATVALFVCAVFFCRTIEKRSLRSMGIGKKGALSSALLGAGVAVAVLLLALLFAVLFGGVSLVPQERVRLPLLLLLILGFLVQGVAEATLYFGCFMTSLARGQTLFFSMAISAFAFAFLHPSGVGVTPLALINYFLLGILMALCMIRTGSLFGAAAIHALLCIGEAMLGTPVGGTAYPTSFLTLVLSKGGSILNGGALGLEGGLALTFALTVAVALFAMVKTKEE